MFDLLRQRLFAEHHAQPQALAKLDHATRLLEEGLQGLASLGHPMHLVDGQAPLPTDDNSWPRVYFHLTKAPNGRVVASRWELAELGNDWWPTRAEVDQAEGRRVQEEGRAGIRKRTELVLVKGSN